MRRSRRAVIAGLAVTGAALEDRSGVLALERGVTDAPRLPDKRAVWADVERLNGYGPRYCGNAAHQKFTDFLERELAACGLRFDNIEHRALQQWLPRRIALTAGGEALPVGAFCRWSATTGPAGVTAPLHYCGKIEGPSRFDLSLDPASRSRLAAPPQVSGKIALVEVAAGIRPLARMFDGQVRSMIDKDQGGGFPATQGPSASSQALAPDGFEDRLKAAGAVGVVYAWIGLADEDAQGQSRSGTEALPSIWVTPSTGAKLRSLAAAGTPATLTVEADTAPDVATRTIVATLPGESEETIVLWTHTDGPNALQENGGVAILNLMRGLVKLPKAQRKRTITVVMVEGHFAEQYLPTSAWMKERPELVKNAVAFLAVEHLGASEWLSDPKANSYRPTGRRELAFAFCPTPAMQALASQAAARQRIGREAIIGTDKFAFTPAMAAYRQARLATFAYISTPSYLMADVANGHIDKLDPDLFHEQLAMLARLVRALDVAPRDLLKET